MNTPSPKATRLFTLLTNWPKTILILSVLMIAATASFMPKIHKDTSSDAFIEKDDPVLLYREHVRRTFGLEDPIVVAVVNDGENGVFNSESLALVGALTEKVAALPNVDPDKIMSLATESNIVGTFDGMEVTDFYDPLPTTQAHADAIRDAVQDFPLYQGSLVARNGQSTLIIAELLDQEIAEQTYQDVMAVVAAEDIPDGNAVHVAGEGAISGYLATYIDNDAKTLNPLAGVVITIVLFVAFRTVAGALLPNVIVLGTVAASLGLMAAFGVSFYVITNGLATILIGIAVADSIHILSQVYEEKVRTPDASQREITVRAMAKMWQPVTLTTITTIAGFMGLWLGAEMPPMKYFGLFAAIGVAGAWFYSMTFLPAALTLFNIKPSRLFAGANVGDRYGHLLAALGARALKHSKVTLAIGILVAVLGVAGTSRVLIQEAQIENFQTDEPLYIADTEINARMDGTYFLDVIVEADEKEALFQPANLRRMESLQAYVEGLPAVHGSTSVVDYIKQMHKAVNENRQEFYTIPDDPDLVAQLFFLYAASGDPTDFEEEVDYDYQKANIRFNLPVADYQLLTQLIPEIQTYVDTRFNTASIKATLSGRVAVTHKWIQTIEENHVKSLGLSLLFVFIATVLVFRSSIAGLFALVPVVMALLLVYAVMGFGGIWLGVGTSMFAAIAIGLGIDFAIHTLDRMKDLLATRSGSYDERLQDLFPSTGRALFFNFAALALGFAVLTTSEVPPLLRFGLLVVTAVSTAFLAGITLLPVLGKLVRPAFLFRNADEAGLSKPASVTASLLIAATGAALLLHTSPADADTLPSADEVIAKVNAREEGEWVSRTLKMELIDRRGKTRTRDTEGYRRYFGDEKRTVLFYTAPSSVKGTGFLTYDYPDADTDDDQWLYLPALRKIRRISASDRGDYFLGTDLSYEDIKKEGKVAAEDYAFKTMGLETVDGFETIVIEGIPKDEETAKELGYGRVLWRIDPTIWMSRKAEMWDVGGNPLKVVHNSDIRKVSGIWTTHRIDVENLKTGHRTIFTFAEVDYGTEVDEAMFEQRSLKRGR
ncbi:outer membrane lipoprotein-sorting protein [Kordiimonas lacus]|uniref:SSD domain-containing protein n=1 Tax=Kordiimonas lacus TaxID=637679 RepID=A0A1G7E9Z6_9PROT|nr:outer membrane lipoprotein-sorting protein [Kordiimonas lacus]SDE60410.1 hypothetical protein SAMN04488071_3354 [Kordiimonas lacus]